MVVTYTLIELIEKNYLCGNNTIFPCNILKFTIVTKLYVRVGSRENLYQTKSGVVDSGGVTTWGGYLFHFIYLPHPYVICFILNFTNNDGNPLC